MRKVTILITLLMLSDCMWSHNGMNHGDDRDCNSSSHQK
jgi:hypothetical protein